MAEHQGNIGSMQEELEGMVECPVHFGILIRPKSLPCGHVICLDCIRRWVEARRGILVCPECNNEQILPQDGVDGLPSAYRLIKLCEYLGNMNIVQAGAQGDVAPAMMRCEVHQDLPLDRICRDCKQPVCQQCARDDHVGHMCLDGSTFMKHMDRPLKKLQDQARVKQRETARHLMEITNMTEQLQVNRTSATDTIDQYVTKLIEKARTASDQLKQQVETMFNAKSCILENQKSTLEGQIEEIEATIQLANAQPGDLEQNLASLGPLVDDASKRLQELQKIDILSAPKTSKDICVEMDGTILEWFDPRGNKKIGQVYTTEIPCPHESELTVMSNPVLLSEEVEVQLTMKDGHGAEVKVQDGSFISSVVTLPNEKSVQQLFKQRADGKFYTKFRPQCIGKFKLITNIYNQKVKNSPLKILVKPRGTSTIDLKGYPPFNSPHDVKKVGNNYLVLDDDKIQIVDKEGRMVNKFVIKDKIFQPYAVAWHDQSFYVTALKGQKVVKFSKTGLQILEIGKGILEAPTGIAVDKNGTIYVAEDRKGCIYVFRSDGQLSHQISSPGGDRDQMSHPWYIKINKRNHLVVADSGNHRIQVFDIKTAKIVRSIYVEHQGKPLACRGLALDGNDNILVTARSPGKAAQFECVMVYSPDGDFLGSFAESPPRKGLHFARGISVVCGENKNTALVVDGGNATIRFYVI